MRQSGSTTKIFIAICVTQLQSRTLAVKGTQRMVVKRLNQGREGFISFEEHASTFQVHKKLRFQVLSAASMNMRAFCDIAPCSVGVCMIRVMKYHSDDGGSTHL
jgi:hypothetical protein